jgi:hypothetical protein
LDMGAAFLSVNLVVATLFYQKAESLSFFYLRNLLYLIPANSFIFIIVPLLSISGTSKTLCLEGNLSILVGQFSSAI